MKNPKEKFLNLLSNIVQNFEEETGCEINNIHFERISTAEKGDFLHKTIITDTDLEIK